MYLVHLISIDLEESRSLNSPTLALLHALLPYFLTSLGTTAAVTSLQTR